MMGGRDDAGDADPVAGQFLGQVERGFTWLAEEGRGLRLWSWCQGRQGGAFCSACWAFTLPAGKGVLIVSGGFPLMPNSFLTVRVGGTLPQESWEAKVAIPRALPLKPRTRVPKLAVPLLNALASGTWAPQGHNAKHGLLPHGADQGLRGLFED